MDTLPSPLPMMPCLVPNPGVIDQEGRTVVIDSKGGCHTRHIEALGSNMRYSLTWQAGWILALDLINHRTFLSNPWSLEKIELPHFPHHQLLTSFDCALSDKPANDGCLVVVLHPTETILWYCRVGEDEWIEYSYDVGVQQMDIEGLVWEKIVMSSLTPCKGKFYCFITNRKLGVLEFNPLPTTRVMVLDGIPKVVPPSPEGSMARVCSFEMDGELCYFFAYYVRSPSVTTSIALYKLDVVAEGKQWRQVDEIGDDRALMWSGYHAAPCSAARFGLESNCVYWLNRSDGLMHIINVPEKVERVCEPSEDLPKDVPKLSRRAFWLLPME